MKTLATLVICTGLLPAQDTAGAAARAREENRLNDAIRLYRQAVAENPKWTEGWWYLGTLLYDQDDYASAAPAFKEAAALDPKHGISFIMLGLSEAKLGRKAQALEHLQQGRALGIPGDPQLRRVLLYTLGTLWIERGNDRDDFDNAQDVFEALVRYGVDSDDLTMSLGLALLRLRPPPDNVELIRAAGRAGVLAAQRDKSAVAMAAYEQLAGTFPMEKNVQFAFGKFLLSQGDDTRAVAAFKKEIGNTPNHLLACLGIAGILSHSDPPAALPYAVEAVKLAPALPEAHFLWGVSLVGAGELSRGIRELEIAQRGAPNKAKIYFELGRAYARAKRPSDAARARNTFQLLTQKEQSASTQPLLQ